MAGPSLSPLKGRPKARVRSHAMCAQLCLVPSCFRAAELIPNLLMSSAADPHQHPNAAGQRHPWGLHRTELIRRPACVSCC